MVPNEKYRRFIIRCLRDDRLHSNREIRCPDLASVTEITDDLEVGPLFHYWVRREGHESEWPATVLDHWQSEAHLEGTIEAIRSEELNAVVRAATIADVEVLLYKGAALRHLAYETPQLRPSNDTDLLVRRSDVAEFSRILIDAGYEVQATHRGMDSNHEIVFWRRGTLGLSLTLDVHWELSNPAISRALPLEAVFARAVSLPTTSGGLKAVGPAHSLLMSVLHCFVHRKAVRRSIWFYDTKRLLQTVDEAEVSALIQGIEDHDVQRLCCEGLRMTCATFEMPTPLWLDGLGVTTPTTLPYYLRDNRTPTSDLLQRVRELPTWKARLVYLRAFLVPSAWFIRENFGWRSNLGVALGYVRFWHQELWTKLLRR